jgi:carboxypeptidase Taq
MERKFKELRNRLHEVEDLRLAAALLEWDQATYMPPGGAEARGRQLALLSALAQDKFTDSEVGRLLDALVPFQEQHDYDSFEASLIRKTRNDYEKAVRVPTEFVSRMNIHSTTSYQNWANARPDNNFKAVEDNLKKTLDMSREYSEFFSGYEHIADPHIDRSDPGMKASDIKQVFGELRKELVPIVKAIVEQAEADDRPVKQEFAEDEQLAFGQLVIEDFGYDFQRGRQDKTLHPFMTKFSLGDVRITTRVKKDDLSEGLFSTLHEAGHGMYELGIDPSFEGTPLADGISSGVHESQSRTWENIVGRSLGFWKHYYPKLQGAFREQLEGVKLQDFYRAINKVSRSLIRTDADEVTYNLHVMIRFDLELDLLEGNLEVKDLPEAWHTRYEQDLGLRAPNDMDGVLQDVHWYAGLIGGSFQGYTLGNIMASLFYDQALKAHPNIPEQIEQGKFNTLHTWLKDNLYVHGAKFTPDELLNRVTGGPLHIGPYIDYLKSKYGQLYEL